MYEQMMSHFELSRRLGRVRDCGVDVPMLNLSEYRPVLHETKPDGTRVYDYGIVVKPGQVIDDHGNVVDLAALEKEAFRKMMEIRLPSDD